MKDEHLKLLLYKIDGDKHTIMSTNNIFYYEYIIMVILECSKKAFVSKLTFDFYLRSRSQNDVSCKDCIAGTFIIMSAIV
jgi:hypothetical protein